MAANGLGPLVAVDIERLTDISQQVVPWREGVGGGKGVTRQTIVHSFLIGTWNMKQADSVASFPGSIHTQKVCLGMRITYSVVSFPDPTPTQKAYLGTRITYRMRPGHRTKFILPPN